MMERLTKRLANGNVTFCGNGTPTQNAMMLPKIMKRLAEYEDAEEQGRLVRLPCKVGDTVYVLLQRNMEKEIAQGTVSNVRRYSDNTWWLQFLNLWVDKTFDDFGKTVFLTREEAEEALRKEESNGSNQKESQ